MTKSSREPLLTIWLISLTGSLLAVGFVSRVEFPSGISRIYLGGSLVIHLAYMLLLGFAYRSGDLSQVYPISRGMAPLLVAGLAWAYAGEALPLRGTLGVLLVAGSIASLALRRLNRIDAPSIAAALAIGVCIGGYSFVDAQGVRTAVSPYDFIVWSFILDGIPITFTVLLIRRRRLTGFIRANLLWGLGGGVMATLAYGLVLWAMSQTAMASVSAIRESSVVIAALIGTRLLGEPYGRQRTLASMGVAAGILLISL